VEYVIEAHFDVVGQATDANNPAKHISIFNRRAKSGQCYKQPHFGLEEFAANFELIEGDAPKSPLSGTVDLGFMLCDMVYEGYVEKDGVWSDKVTPRFYRPKMIDGVIDVRSYTKEAKA
jgi:CRISPR-associated protein Cas5d